MWKQRYVKDKMGCKSSFSGEIHEIPFIAVDNFENTDRSGYFLSHFHTDHTCGLYSHDLYANLAANNIFIYTSEVTASIIQNYKPKLGDYVKGLKLGSNTISINNKGNEEIFNVIVLPAGHCFGSVMFLFKINDKTILYTGDFRLSPNSVSKFTHFHDKNGDAIVIDAMYVDTTFQNVQEFPTRRETVESAIMEIRDWIGKSEKHCVALHTSANYGYEYVFDQIYENLGLKVYVPDKKIWNVYSKFHDILPSVTANSDSTRLHVCRNNRENHTHRNCLPNGENKIYLYIHFSARIWEKYGEDETFMRKYNNRINVCFATHSSRAELLNFINYLSPKKIIGFPEDYVKSPVKNNNDLCFSPKRKRVSLDLDRKLGSKVPKDILDDMF